jgi:hypothetical protein
MATFRDLSNDLAFPHPIKLAVFLADNNLPMHRRSWGHSIVPRSELEPTFAAVLRDFVLAHKVPNYPSTSPVSASRVGPNPFTN